MSGQGILRNKVLGRVAIGLLVAAALVLFAPVAAATPESDADAAITAAWDANGGDTGPLGPKDGGVYPVGEGFGQNFAGGKIFFTPAIGAHIMSGAILEKYESLGGPADSDLGFPTIDEGAGRAPDSRNTTFSAADKPVIFWTPDTGARVVRGPINAAWDKLGGSAGQLGVPAEDEAYRGDVVTQKFTGGELVLRRARPRRSPPCRPIWPDSSQAWRSPTTRRRPSTRPGAPPGERWARSAPQKARRTRSERDGLGQNFAGGKIFYSPETGANVVTGQVLAKYESVGGPEGDLGFPTSNEVDGGLAPASRMSTFAADDKPVIFWTPDYGAVIVRGAMNAAWEKLGGAKGDLGAPMADQTENGNVITQRFSGGVVSWDSSTNKFTTEPAESGVPLSGLQVPGQEAPKAPSSPQASDTNGGNGFQWMVVAARGRSGADPGRTGGLRRAEEPAPPCETTSEFEPSDGDLGLETPAYSGGAPAATDQATTDDHSAELFGDQLRARRAGAAVVSDARPAVLSGCPDQPVGFARALLTNPPRRSPPRQRSVGDEEDRGRSRHRRHRSHARADRSRTRPADRHRAPRPDRDRRTRAVAAPRFACRWTIPMRRPRAIRSRPTPSRGCTGHPAARSTTTLAPKSGSPVRNSLAPMASSGATSSAS